MRKIGLGLIVWFSLLPVVALAHEGGPPHNYEVLVPGEVLGLSIALIAAFALLFRMRRAPSDANHQFIIGLTLAMLSGVLFYLSFPPFDLGWLMWVALVPMIVAQLMAQDSKLKVHPSAKSLGAGSSKFTSLIANHKSAALYQALTIFIGYALVFMHVFPSALPTGIEQMVGLPIPAWVYILLGIALVSIIFYATGLPGGSLAFHQKTDFKYFIIGPALGWMGMEQVRVFVQLGQSWGRIPGTQYANIPLIQLAAFGGQWIVGLLVVATNYALALLLVRWLDKAREARTIPNSTRQAIVTLALVVIAHLVGYTLLGNPAQTVRVAAVQIGSDLGDHPVYYAHWLKADYKAMDEAVLKDFEPLIREAARRGAKIIALPEAMLWNDPSLNLGLVSRLTSLSKELGAYITFTFYLWNDPNSRNELYMATPNGEWKGFYAKNHPIWYIGEYSITAGQYPVYDAGFVKFGNFICYDNAYTDVATTLASRGASLLTSSNHDWPEGAYGFYTQSIYRAVENRLAIVRADWRVGSAIIDPYGRIISTTSWSERETKLLVADVPIIPERGTVFMRFGDWLAYVGVAALGLMWLLGLSWPLRLRTSPQPL